MIRTRRTLFTGFMPNMTTRDVWSACYFLFFPWQWGKLTRGIYGEKICQWLREFFEARYVFLFDSGRSSLFYALKALGVGEGDDVLVQAYTCVVVVNAIKWTGARPVYVDIDGTFTMDIHDAEKKITPRTKVVIIQHTFGQSADLDALLQLTKKYSLRTIEDCAQSLGGVYKRKLLGTFGDIAMLSFGSEKVVSCVRGGALVTNDDACAKKIREFQSQLSSMRRWNVVQHLLMYPFFFLGKPLYGLGVGKLLLAAAKKAHLLVRIISPPEKQGKQTLFFPCLFPNALARILYDQLHELREINLHREVVARLYVQGIHGNIASQKRNGEPPVYLEYPIVLKYPERVARAAKEEGIFLGIGWSGAVIVPKDSDQSITGYTNGSCPQAEYVAKHIVLLPTNRHITQEDVKRIIGCVSR